MFWRSANCCDGRLQLLFSSKLRLAWFSNHVTAPITFRLCNKSNSCTSNGISNKNDYFAISGLNRCKELSCVFSLITLFLKILKELQLLNFQALWLEKHFRWAVHGFKGLYSKYLWFGDLCSKYFREFQPSYSVNFYLAWFSLCHFTAYQSVFQMSKQ